MSNKPICKVCGFKTDLTMASFMTGATIKKFCSKECMLIHKRRKKK